MVDFAREPWSDELFEEFYPLSERHYDEIAHYKDIPMDMDVEKYFVLQKMGTLKIFTARKEGRLIGYAFFMVNRNLHYQGSLQAMQDIIFILPEERGFGSSFIRFCDRELQGMGVDVVYHHVKAAHNFGPLLERLGYNLIDHIYGKRLKE